ncbi:MAG TPA: phage baseplate assembly protein V [Candidatus Binataceae bacterium]|nr:phage baseplate assembly protein V [Candidatus Binataceae bacterium]
MQSSKSPFRTGIVSAQDVAHCRVRVTFPDRDQMNSWWLPVMQPYTQNNKAFRMPDLGEQVVCLMDAHDEDGVVLGAIYSTIDAPPTGMTANINEIQFSDGALCKYDRSAHAMTVSLPSGGTLTLEANGASVVIDASGDVELTAAGNITLKTGTYNDSVNNIIATFNAHTHQGVAAGSQNSGTPNQVLT